MKLLHCSECGDVHKLQISQVTKCSCGKARGFYLSDGWRAAVNTSSIVIGMGNGSLSMAIAKTIYKPENRYDIIAWVQTPENNPRLFVYDVLPTPQEVNEEHSRPCGENGSTQQA